jgi:hypothetical protein
MFSRHKSQRLAVLFALLICVGAVAMLKDAAPTASATGQGISRLFLAPVPCSGQLLRDSHSQRSRVLSRPLACVTALPVLCQQAAVDAGLVSSFSPARRSAFPDTRSGRSPPPALS